MLYCMPIRKIFEDSLLMNKLIIESISDGMWTIDNDGLCTFINKAALEMLGYTREQCLGKNMHELVHYKYLDGVEYPASNCTRCETYYSMETNTVESDVFWKSDGSPLYVRYTSNPVFVENELIGVHILFSDISDLKNKQDEINRIKENQENLINTTNDLIWSVDVNYNLLSFNKAYDNRISMVTGKPVTEGATVIQTEFGQELVAKWTAYYDKALKGERFKVTEQVYNPELDEMEFGHITFVPMYDGNGQIYGAACYSKDITEEVNSRKTIADAYSDLANIFNQSIDIICTINEEGRFIKLSAACAKIWGYSPEELTGRLYLDLVHKGDVTATNNIAVEIMNGKEITHFENRYMAKSGVIVPMLWSAKWDNKGRVMYCIARDNTDKREDERRLMESEAFLKEAQRLAKMGSWKFDFKTNKLTWSDELYNVFDTDKDTFLETHDSFMSLIDDVDRELALKTSINTQKTGEPFQIQYHVTTLKGEKRVIEEYGYGEIDEDGNVIRLFGTAQDITERKKAEIKIEEANKRFELVTKATFDTIWDWDLIKNNVYWGEGYESLFGHKIDGHQMNPSSWTDNIHPEDFNRVLEGIYRVINGEGTKWFDEYRFRKNDNTYAVVLDKGIVVRDKSGNPVRMVGAMQDITQHKIEEQRLKLLESVVISANDAVLITEAMPVDEPGPRIIYANNAFFRMTGYTPDEIIGQTPRILQGEKTDRVELDRLNAALKNFESCETTVINYKKNGEEFWVNFFVAPVLNEKEEYTHFIAIERDITDTKNTEIQLRLLNEHLQMQANELAISNSELEQFAFVASHDLQEPLRMVTSFLTQLEKKYHPIIDDRGKQYIFYAVDGAKRMRQIILDLLEYSRIGRITEKSEEVNLNTIIEDVLALYKKKIEESKAKVIVRELPIIFTYKVLFRQIFQNLIGNGLKYQKENGIPEIIVSCEDNSGYWQFSISDNGIGIESEYYDHIFVIFKRLHAREEYSGTGMGLAITKKIVENLGGKIWVESEKDNGSTFFFTIPKKS